MQQVQDFNFGVKILVTIIFCFTLSLLINFLFVKKFVQNYSMTSIHGQSISIAKQLKSPKDSIALHIGQQNFGKRVFPKLQQNVPNSSDKKEILEKPRNTELIDRVGGKNSVSLLMVNWPMGEQTGAFETLDARPLAQTKIQALLPKTIGWVFISTLVISLVVLCRAQKLTIQRLLSITKRHAVASQELSTSHEPLPLNKSTEQSKLKRSSRARSFVNNKPSKDALWFEVPRTTGKAWIGPKGELLMPLEDEDSTRIESKHWLS